VTSVSRSEHDDETPEGTGTGVSAEGVAPVARPARTAGDVSTAPKAKRPAARRPAAKSAGAKPTADAADTAPAAAPRKASATKKPSAAKEAAAGAEAAGAAGETTASKRTPASRQASAGAASARSTAAKTSRTTRTTAKGDAPSARSRAASEAAKKRQTQRVAASMTTDTTAAERTPRKPAAGAASAGAAAAASGAGAPEAAIVSAPVDDAIDETTTERVPPLRPAKRTTARTAAAAAAAATATAAAAEATVEAPAPGAPPVAEEAEPEAASESEAASAPGVVSTPAVSKPEVASEAAPADLVEAVEVVEPAPVEPVAAAVALAPTAATPAETGIAGSHDVAVSVIAAPQKPAPRKKRTLRVARAAPPADAPRVLLIDGLVKQFSGNTAVDHISLDVRAGSFYGIVGPNGAGKTTTLSMVTGLLRPDAGSVRINGIDAWADPLAAKRATGVLPDRLRLFDRLTGAQLLSYSGTLRGLDNRTVRERSADLIAAFGLDDAVDRLVADYSAGMTKKIALACAMIHAPRLLVLDEPFESVDPVSAANLTDILERYVAGGGTVVLSSHGMDLIERVCDSAAIIVGGRVLASGTLDEVRAGQTLEDRFVELAGGRTAAEGMEWLHSFSD
jgi:ABC-type multidrug transport system ATPase subunit